MTDFSDEPFKFEEACERGWKGALALIRQSGEDPDELVRQAGAAIAYYQKHPYEPTEEEWDLLAEEIASDMWELPTRVITNEEETDAAKTEPVQPFTTSNGTTILPGR